MGWERLRVYAAGARPGSAIVIGIDGDGELQAVSQRSRRPLATRVYLALGEPPNIDIDR